MVVDVSDGLVIDRAVGVDDFGQAVADQVVPVVVDEVANRVGCGGCGRLEWSKPSSGSRV